MNSIGLLIYPNFSEIHVTMIAAVLQGCAPLRVFSFDGAPVTGESGLHIAPDFSLADMMHDEHQIVLIPGGEPEEFAGRHKLNALLHHVAEHGGVLASLGEGAVALAQAGLLEGRAYTATMTPPQRARYALPEAGFRPDDAVVAHEPLITAQAWAFNELAYHLGRRYFDLHVDAAMRSFFAGQPPAEA